MSLEGLVTAAWRWMVLLIGVGLTGGIAYTCWEYRRSYRMSHVLPLGASYLLLVAGSVVSYQWPEWRTLSWADEAGLSVAYGLGAWGLGRLISTSTSPGGGYHGGGH